jgi:hypothetical protein
MRWGRGGSKNRRRKEKEEKGKLNGPHCAFLLEPFPD